jgi:hypothetical protein
MTVRKGPKINQLLQNWPRGTVATQTWLNSQGISSKLAAWHVGSGWLTRFGPRAFVQTADRVDWRGGLYTLQTQLGLTIHAAARTALELRGLAHFVPQGSSQRIQLISDRKERLPAWFREREWSPHVEHQTLSLFEEAPEESLTHLDCGGFAISMSAAERAVLEEMRLAKTNAEIAHAIQLMENLTTLRPALVQELLECCSSIKAKRLFLWSAERVGHAWVEGLDTGRVDLGSGKRQLFKGGQLDSKYQITVPLQQESPDA